jgi:hypothetical protein
MKNDDDDEDYTFVILLVALMAAWYSVMYMGGFYGGS